MATAAINQPLAGTQKNTGHPRRWWILGVVSFAAFTLFADNTIVNTALPSISRDLDASTSQLQWIVDSYVLMLAGLLLVGGAIGDLFGRRRWFGVGLGIFGLGATVAALSLELRAAHPRTRHPGHGRCTHHARHPLHHQQRLPGQ